MKRPYNPLAASQDAAPPVERRPRLQGRHQLMLMVPGDVVALLIGKGGMTIKEMEGQSGTVISFAKTDEHVLGESLRPITILGDTLEANTVAQCIILQKVQEIRPDADPLRMKLRLLVLNSLVGNLIGSKGSGIKAITGESSVYLSFCKDRDMPHGSPYRLCTLAGSAEELAWTQQRISERHEELFQELPGADPGNWVEATGSPNPALVPPQQQQPASFPAAPVAAPLRPAPITVPPREHVLAQRDREYHEREYQPQWDNQREWFAQGQPGGGAALAANKLPHLTTTFWMPNEHVGAFIGSQGANIRRITDSTRVYISVQKEDAVATVGLAGDMPMRPVVISGPGEAVFKAQDMAMRMLLHIQPEMSFTTVAAPVVAGADQQPEQEELLDGEAAVLNFLADGTS